MHVNWQLRKVWSMESSLPQNKQSLSCLIPKRNNSFLVTTILLPGTIHKIDRYIEFFFFFRTRAPKTAEYRFMNDVYCVCFQLFLYTLFSLKSKFI